MTETPMTEVRRNTGKDILIYVTLAAVAVLSAVIYLWVSFSPLRESAETTKPWALAITSVLPLGEEDLMAIRSLSDVERIERSPDTASAELLVWISGEMTDKASFDNTLSEAETELGILAAQREAARVAELQEAYRKSADAERKQISAKLAELVREQEKLDVQARALAERRLELDKKNAALLERENTLSGVRTALNREGRTLDEEEVQLSAPDESSRAETARRYRQQREAWYAGGEDYLDVYTLYELDRQALDREEQLYAADYAAFETENRRLKDACAALEAELSDIPETVAVEDCTWTLRRNPEGWVDPANEETAFSPLRLAIQMLFLSVAGLSAWLFCAKLLSSAAGTIAKPSQKPEDSTRRTGKEEEDLHVL